jgi:hypothetical protein
MDIVIKDNFPDVQRWLDTQSKQPRYAAAVALTRTAQDVRVAEREERHACSMRPRRTRSTPCTSRRPRC